MITQRIKLIFSAYRRDDFADPEGFVLQLGAVLERYADEVIHTVTDPRTGIQRRSKFPPSIAEIVEACEAEATAIATRERYRSMPAPVRLAIEGPRRPKPQPGHRANCLVPPHAPQYAAMLARAQDPQSDPLEFKCDNQGLWVDYRWLVDMPRHAAANVIDGVTARMAVG